MRYFKKLIYLIFIVYFTEADTMSFRGKSKDQIIGQKVPLSFSYLVSENYNILPSQFNSERGSYLIIAPDGIINYLDDFVSFKKSQGFDVYIKSLSETGETAQGIKESIYSILIDDPMLEYVLLIGDVDGFSELPSFYYGPENDVTDQKYSYLLGDDNIPDVFIGRLSIDSLSDLAVIMSKTINYSRNPLEYNSDWLSRGIVVAGNYSNTYPIPVTPKWTSYWLRDELIDFGYSQVDTVFYPPIQQGASYIIPLINNGAGIVNYRGWGDANGWHYPEFHVDDVNDLNNGWLTPVFMSYVCNSNDFANNVDPCLAEAIIRGGTPTVPKGGVAFVGPSDLHTSTKYNNIINAYMYDAMLNHGIVELGPAMQAGQYGLVKEFPAQSGPGEAQEFYSHVYNILGDPSLQVYLNTPNQFEIVIQEFSNIDGFIKLIIEDSQQNRIANAVISIMQDDQILKKGISDINGEFVSTLNIDNTGPIDIYANKKMFIQGYKSLQVESSEGLKLSNLTFILEDDEAQPSFGSPVNLNFEIKNTSQTETTGSFEGILKFSDFVLPQELILNFPQLSPGESVNFNNLIFTAFKPDLGNSIVAAIENSENNIISKICIDFNPLAFNLNLLNNPSPGEIFSPTILLSNFSNSKIDSVFIKLTPVSDGVNMEMNETDFLLDILPFEEHINSTNYNIEL